MANIVCVPCQRFFKIERNGVAFEEGFGDGTKRAYKLWLGDRYQCEGCGTQIVVPGRQHVAEHYQKDFGKLRESLHPDLFVDDCPGAIPQIFRGHR